MFDAKKQLANTLSKILPTYYELFCDSNTSKPCITYRETNNYQYLLGTTLGYSYVRYDIKLWGKAVGELENYALQIDDALREIGYTRISYDELTVEDNIEFIMTYEGLAHEEIIH